MRHALRQLCPEAHGYKVCDVDVLPALRRYFDDRADVAAAWLFGSRARGEGRADSDVDVAILLAGRPMDAIHAQLVADEIRDDLVLATGRTAIDVVPVNHANLELTHRVLRDGVLLQEHDPRARIRFELRHHQEYTDFMPVIEAYRRATLEDA